MKYLKYIFIAGLMLLVVGCATGQATGTSNADIDATVEARLAIIPTPTPQIVIQEVEVIVEKEIEVPVIKEVVVESEVIKEVVIELPKEVEVIKEVEVVKEITVEKVVEIVVTATPTPKPTATPTPLPTPTATPTPDASEYISMSTSSGTTNTGLKYIDVVVKNTHPSLSIDLLPILKYEKKDSDGYIISQDNQALIYMYNPCLLPNKSYRFRYPDLNTPFITADFTSTPYFSNSSCIGITKENIDETLIDDVEIDIKRTSDYSFTVEIKNNSKESILWHGEYLIRDIYGNIIIHKRSNFPDMFHNNVGGVVPNGKISVDFVWDGADHIITCDGKGLCSRGFHGDNLSGYVGYGEYSYYIEYLINNNIYGNFTTDLEYFEATLRTIQLIKAD